MKSINKKKIIITVAVIAVIIVLIKVVPMINFVYIDRDSVTNIAIYDSMYEEPLVKIENVDEFIDNLDTAEWRIIYNWEYKWAYKFYIYLEPIGEKIAIYGAGEERGKEYGFVKYNGIHYRIPIEAYDYIESFIYDYLYPY